MSTKQHPPFRLLEHDVDELVNPQRPPMPTHQLVAVLQIRVQPVDCPLAPRMRRHPHRRSPHLDVRHPHTTSGRCPTTSSATASSSFTASPPAPHRSTCPAPPRAASAAAETHAPQARNAHPPRRRSTRPAARAHAAATPGSSAPAAHPPSPTRAPPRRPPDRGTRPPMHPHVPKQPLEPAPTVARSRLRPQHNLRSRPRQPRRREIHNRHTQTLPPHPAGAQQTPQEQNFPHPQPPPQYGGPVRAARDRAPGGATGARAGPRYPRARARRSRAE